MDAYLQPLVDQSPTQLLKQHQLEVEKFLGQHFPHSRACITLSIKRLAFFGIVSCAHPNYLK